MQTVLPSSSIFKMPCLASLAISASFSVDKVLEKCCKIIHASYLLLLFTHTWNCTSGQSYCDFSLDLFLSCKLYFTSFSVMHWNVHSAKARDLWRPFHMDLVCLKCHSTVIHLQMEEREDHTIPIPSEYDLAQLASVCSMWTALLQQQWSAAWSVTSSCFPRRKDYDP